MRKSVQKPARLLYNYLNQLAVYYVRRIEIVQTIHDEVLLMTITPEGQFIFIRNDVYDGAECICLYVPDGPVAYLRATQANIDQINRWEVKRKAVEKALLTSFKKAG